jgi:hypothetical protein
MEALEGVTFSHLDGNIEGATVYQDVPEDTPPPVVILGDMEKTNLGAKGDVDCSIAMTILSVVAAEERRPVLALLDQIETLLDEATLEAEGWTFRFAFETSTAALSGEEGVYVGTALFTVTALRND